MQLFGRKASKPKTDAQMLLEALGGVKQREERKQKALARKMGGGWKRFLDRRILLGLGLVLVALIADGVRRENQEFEATITELAGQVSVQEREGASRAPAVVKSKLVDGNIISTGPNSAATLSFPDGSVLLVGPATSMTVKLLEYNRGGAWRGRSFYVKLGQIWATVSPHFGQKSELKVYTPSSVAAVRGTTFYVAQSRAGDQSEIACADGSVRVSGLVGNPTEVPAGAFCAVTRGAPARRPAPMTAAQQQTGFGYGALWQPPPGASRLQIVEYAVNQFLNAPLTVLGIGKCGWAFGAIDTTRRTAAMEALRRLRIHLETAAQYPPYLNLATLEELGLPARERNQVLEQLHGRALDRYYCLAGGRDFLIYARARDKARTMFKLTTYGVEPATREEAEAIL